MQCCKKAEEATKDRIVEVGLTSLVWGWLNNDLRLKSLLNYAWQLAKDKLKNDTQARTDLATVIACKLGL